MKNQKNPALSRKKGAGTVALGTTAAVVLGSLLCAPPAMADTVDTEAVSAAHGHGIFVEGLGLDVVGSAKADSEFPDDIGANGNELDVELLETLGLNVGTLNLPLIKGSEEESGLLHLGNLGALSSYAYSELETTSTASAGILGENGALNVDGDPGNGIDPSKINLTDLLSQVISDDLVNEVLSEASITLGALGSTATETEGVVDSEYGVADLQLDVKSPLVGGIVGEVDGLVNDLITPIDDLTGTGGAVEILVSGVVDTIDSLSALGIPLANAELNDLSIDSTALISAISAELLANPVSNESGSVVLDLENGTIHVDLAEFVVDGQAGATNLNDLDPNTDVLSGDTVNAILAGVTEALTGAGENSLLSKISGLVTDGIYDVELNVDIQAEVLGIVNAPVTVSGTLGGFLGIEGHNTDLIDVSGINVVGIPVGTVLDPITDALTGLVSDIGGALQPAIDTVLDDLQPTVMALVQPIVTRLLDEALEPVLTGVVGLTINEQPAVGDLGADSFTVRALALDVLPGVAGGVGVDLGSSSVKALDEAPADAEVDIQTPVDGEEVPVGPVDVTGTGEPGTEVTVSIPGQDDQTATVGEDNTWTVTFPDMPVAEHTATATDENGSTDAVTFNVVEANTEVNTADNTEVNTADNTEVNTADNTDVNTADNDAENTDVNTA
ncbi:choice-of-anchor G family protein, partial [Glutamicibacter sp. AOP33-2CA-4]|uniref:choice-of-anchor G family protein n=1 Tax=Glutamicibacter sp. AOP33-2CA-4 TaxID=3457690 RepID=UPI00403394B6